MKRAASRSRPAKSRKGDSQATPRARPSAAAWRRSGMALLWALTIAGVGWGMEQARQQARAIHATAPLRLQWTTLPRWLDTPQNRVVLDEIETAAGLLPTDDLHDPDICRRVAGGLTRSPWVASVERVVKLPDGAVSVNATFREPLAYVDVRGRAYLVDTEGVRLPVECAAAYIKPGEWFLLEGARAGIPNVGEKWAGDDLAAGLALVSYLRDAAVRHELPFRSWLRAVDVANFKREQRPHDAPLRIRTIRPDCYINWGEPPGEEFPVEPDARRKIDMLRAVYAELGQLPQRVLDVRGKDGVRSTPASGG